MRERLHPAIPMSNVFACSDFHSTLSRRHALKVGGLGLLGLSMPGILRALEEP